MNYELELKKYLNKICDKNLWYINKRKYRKTNKFKFRWNKIIN